MKFQYNPEISLGNILQIVALISSVLAAYVSIQNTLVAHTEKLREHTSQIEALNGHNIRQDQAIVDGQRETRVEIKELNKNLTDYIINRNAKSKP